MSSIKKNGFDGIFSNNNYTEQPEDFQTKYQELKQNYDFTQEKRTSIDSLCDYQMREDVIFDSQLKNLLDSPGVHF